MPRMIVFPKLGAPVRARRLATAAGIASPASVSAAVPASPSIGDVLDAQRDILTDLAEEMVFGSPTGRASAMALPAAVSDPYQVLEGIGAIVLEDAMVDPAAFRERYDAAVFEDCPVPLIAPLKSGAPAVSYWHLPKINVDAARAQNLTGRGVWVGVLDTGIDASHVEFKGRTIMFEEFDAKGGRLGGPARDAGSHGTHVCGLIAGTRAGVAPDARLAVAAVLTQKTATGNSGQLVQIARGLNWLLTEKFRGDGADPGVDVINASLGVTGYVNFLYRALANARVVQGTLMIAAIGNEGAFGVNHHSSPGNYDIVLGIGATDSADVVAPFSDWGMVLQHAGLSKPDLCAPGVDIWSSVPGGSYAALSGTSMATPIVSGAAALCIQKDSSLSQNAMSLQRRLNGLILPVPGQAPRIGRGRLDLSGI